MGALRAGRNGPTQTQLALRGLLLLAAFGVLLFVMTLSVGGAFADTSQVRTKLDTAGGAVVPGSDVKMNGLAVGKVSAITGDEDGVTLELEMDNGSLSDIPGSVEARVLPATVFGTSYIDLVAHHGTSGPALRAGALIPQDRSTPTLELQKALDSIDTLIDALGPAELSSALHSLASALDGQGDDLGRTIDLADRYLTRLGPVMPTVRDDIRLLATNVETVRATAPDLLDAVDDALSVGAHLVEQRAQLTSLLSGGTNLVRDADRFLTDNERDLVAVVRQAAVVTDAIYDERNGLRTGLLSIGVATRKVPTTGEGQWVRVDGVVIDPKYDPYTRRDCPRYQGHPGGNCGGAGRSPVGALVGGALLDGGGSGR